MKLSLGAILAICLAGLQLIAVLSVVLSSYLTSERTLLNHARGLLSDLGVNTIEHSISFLKPARETAELAKQLAQSKVVSSDNPELLEKILFQQLQLAPQFSGLYYGDEFGNFVYVMRSEIVAKYRTKIVKNNAESRSIELILRDEEYNVVKRSFDPTDTYDPRVRPWYERASIQRKLVWTDPYIFFSSQKPGITVASPVVDPGNKLRGVIGVDIEIEAISDFLSQLTVGNGAVMILNNHGEVIAHPNSNLIKVKNEDGSLGFASIADIGDPIANAAFSDLSDLKNLHLDREIKSQFEYENKTFVSTLIPFGNEKFPWTIAIYASEDNFIGELKENRTRNIWIAAAIALVTGLVGLILANRILRPVREFATRAELVTQSSSNDINALPKTYSELEEASEKLVREIAQRKMSEREYGLTFEMASRGMAQISADTGQFIKVNSQFEDIIGYSGVKILEMTISDILHPEDVENYVSFHEAFREGAEYNQENKYVRKDGKIIWLRVNAILILDEFGTPLHAVATVHDITTRKISERKISELSRDLSHHSRINMMGQMATGLAHELNQPLTAITQNVDAALMMLKEQKNVDPEVIEILQEMDQQAHRGGDIIRALRGFVRKDEGNKSAFDLAELIEQAVRLVHPESSAHNIDISFKGTELPRVMGARIQVAQVVVNLLRNAIEALSNTQSTVKEITLKARIKNKYVEVFVEDTGSGIDGNIELFRQFETNKTSGMGLGLSFSRSIIEANGGNLWHDSECKSKTRFCFTLEIENLATKNNNKVDIDA